MQYYRIGETLEPLESLPPEEKSILAVLCPEELPGALLPQGLTPPQPPEDLRENLDITQGKLCMGFVTPVTAKSADFPAMQLLCAVYGGDVTSKLFQNVREKQSLCYSIGAGYYSAKGIILVSAGMDFDKEPLVRAEALKQLEACCRGDISGEELTAARRSLVSALESVPDSPGALESYYSAIRLGGSALDPQAHRAALEAVTREDLVRCAKTVRLHSSCFLTGGCL